MHSEKRQEVEELKYREALILKTQPLYLTQYMVLCGTAAILSALAILGGLMFWVHGFSIGISHPSDPFYVMYPTLGYAESYFYLVIGCAGLFFGSWMAEKWLTIMLGTWSRSNNFDRYDKTVPEEIRKKYQELRERATRSSE
jgi:hypothetical protein